MKKHITYKPKKSPQWEDAVEQLINSTEQVNFYPHDGELYWTIKGSEYRSIILRKDGTWSLD